MYNVPMHETYHYSTSIEKIRRVVPAGNNLKILDLGCGDGRLLADLAKQNEVYGIDQSAGAVEVARTNGVQAIVGDIEKSLPFADASFDGVFALDILEHMVNLTGLLREINRVLKDDGFLIIALPNHFDLRTRLDILRGMGIIKWSQRKYEKKPWDYAHIRFLTLTDVRAMLAEHGLHTEVEQYNFMSGGLLPTDLLPGFIRAWLVVTWPNLWSGKFVMRVRKQKIEKVARIIIDKTPKDF